MNIRHALLLINLQSRGGENDLSSIKHHLEKYNISVREMMLAPSEIYSTIRSNCKEIDLVILAGGDGTMNAAAEALIQSDLPFAIIPVGTANDLARTLGIPRNLEKACKIIGEGYLHRIDLGWVNGKYFFNVASIGISAEVAHRLTSVEVKRRWGIISYFHALYDAVKHNHPFHSEIFYDGRKVKIKAIQISVGNGHYYGGGFSISSDAAIDDQMLDLYALRPMNFWEMIRLVPAVYVGKHGRKPEKIYSLRNKEFRILTHKPMIIDMDGELSAKTPAYFKVIQEAISVCVPKYFVEERDGQ